MNRTGLKIGADQKNQMIRLSLFDENNHNHSLTVTLDSTKTLSVINQLLRATEKLDEQPSKKAVKAVLIEALKFFDTASEK